MNIARYLIPIDSQLSAADYAKKAETVLREMEVISTQDERFPSLFNMGNKSTEPFEKEPDDDEQGFESACIFSGPFHPRARRICGWNSLPEMRC